MTTVPSSPEIFQRGGTAKTWGNIKDMKIIMTTKKIPDNHETDKIL